MKKRIIVTIVTILVLLVAGQALVATASNLGGGLFSPIPRINIPTIWKTLHNQEIPQASPDGTVVYKKLTDRCFDPDSKREFKITSTHEYYSLAFKGKDLVINNLHEDYLGKEKITIDCNGKEKSFELTVKSLDEDNEDDNGPGGLTDETGLLPSIRILEETAKPGDMVQVRVTMTNTGNKNLKDTKVMVSVPEIGIRGASTAKKIKDGKRETSVILLYIPEDAEQGTYDLKITMQNNKLTRIRYRQIDII